MTRASRPVVIITGVSSGIGLATAKQFIGQGWIVVGTVRGRGKGAALRGWQIDLQIADMLKPRDLERVVQTAWRTYGRIDALVCNAGYGVSGPADTLTYAQMDEIMTVNALAPAELVRQVLPLMRRQRAGVIVGMSSVVGLTGFGNFGMYAASKFGLEGLFESLALELAESPVRVKLVEPSSVNTPFWSTLKHGTSRAWTEAERHMAPAHSFARGLPPEDIAKAIWRAANDHSRKLRYPVGRTRWVMLAKRVLPEQLYLRVLRWAAARS
jgi:NAD(P)-dependent dehydrogenase (short-subunit alcohol dehydrogenase family)